MSTRKSIHKAILTDEQIGLLATELNKLKVQNLRYAFAKLLNDIGDILNINIIVISDYLELRKIVLNKLKKNQIFSNTLQEPSIGSSIKRKASSVKHSISRSFRRSSIRNSKPCNKNIISRIFKTENPNDDEKKDLITKFNEFIQNNNCVNQEILHKGTPYLRTHIINMPSDYKKNDTFLKADKGIIYASFIANLNIEDDEKKTYISEIINFYFGVYKDLENLPALVKTEPSDSLLRKRLEELKKGLVYDVPNFNLIVDVESVIDSPEHKASSRTNNSNGNNGNNGNNTSSSSRSRSRSRSSSRSSTKKSQTRINTSKILNLSTPILNLNKKFKLRKEILELLKKINTKDINKDLKTEYKTQLVTKRTELIKLEKL